MHSFSLETMAKRRSNRRDTIVFRPIITTRAQAESLALIYVRVTQLLDARRARLVTIYERTIAQKLRTDSIDELGVELDDIDAALRRLVLELTPDLRRWAFRTEEWHRGKWKRAVLDAVNVDLETLLGPEEVRETIEAFLQRNVGLVRNVSDEARGRISDSIFRGFQRRESAAVIAKEIHEATGMGRKRAIRIAGDQTVKLASALDAERQRQAGLTQWKWKHSGKVHPREWHKERDGNIYTDATAPEDLPGELPYCGCVRQAVLTFDD